MNLSDSAFTDIVLLCLVYSAIVLPIILYHARKGGDIRKGW